MPQITPIETAVKQPAANHRPASRTAALSKTENQSKAPIFQVEPTATKCEKRSSQQMNIAIVSRHAPKKKTLYPKPALRLSAPSASLRLSPQVRIITNRQQNQADNPATFPKRPVISNNLCTLPARWPPHLNPFNFVTLQPFTPAHRLTTANTGYLRPPAKTPTQPVIKPQPPKNPRNQGESNQIKPLKWGGVYIALKANPTNPLPKSPARNFRSTQYALNTPIHPRFHSATNSLKKPFDRNIDSYQSIRIR